MSDAVTIAVLGQGDDAMTLAEGLLAAGARVVGYDSKAPSKTSVPQAESVAAAVHDADVVLSLNSAMLATKYATDAGAAMKPEAIFADLNTATPALKRRLSELFHGNFVDVDAVKPAGDEAENFTMGVAGEQAKKFIDLLTPYAAHLELISKKPGDAAARKLIRSLLAKGMAAVAMDALWAAEAMGIERWAFEEIKREFNQMNEETLNRALTGTIRHVKRRQVEMNDINEMLNEADYMSTTIPGLELTYNRVIHSIKVPFSTSGVMWRDSD